MLILFFAYSDLQAHYLGLESLRSLVSGIPIPRDGENGESVLVTSTFHRNAPTPPLAHWSGLLATLTKIQGDGLYNFSSVIVKS